MKPNIVGKKTMAMSSNLAIGFESFTTAELANIDSTYSDEAVYPWARSATVREDYDCINVRLHSSDIAIGSKIAFGVFLSPNNEKGNLMFQVSGRSQFNASAGSFSAYWILGRKKTNNTVVSSKAAASNELEKYQLIHSWDTYYSNSGAYKSSILDEIFSFEKSGAYVYCLALVIQNSNGAAATTLYGSFISIQLRKYVSELSYYNASR